IIHTIGIVMNAAMVESAKGDFAMYTQGFTPSIWKIVETLDEITDIFKMLSGLIRSVKQ
ncbi:MAG: NAD/NADP octopine/nopaline dehydrogenase family protein, partial [Proteobacteria bacterium]|nr:NAD/NADP octopine/nopaline dehydrogenase family protein [Pseudomonadota bacterium]